MMLNKINFIAETTFRNRKQRFGIKTDDRRRHVYVIGKTGMGKTAMLENMAIQDIQAGQGIGFVDPHGEAAERLLNFVPSERINDVVYFNPSDIEHPMAFNVMEKVDIEHRHLVAAGLMGVFKKIWPDVWSARMEYILNNSILALLEYPDSTLLGVNRMLSDADYRKKVVDKVTDPVVKSFWLQEFARYNQRYEVEATAAIQNKVGQFISDPLMRNIIGQVKSSIDMRKMMDDRKILILNLSKGRIGEDSSRLLGALFITKLQLAAMSRVNIPEEKRKDFFLYIDEFQNFATESFVNILSEARKYRLGLILSHQYIDQMEEEVRDAVFGNVGTIISFRVGAIDGEYLEKEFIPEFTAEDLVNLAKYDIYLKLMIDGVASRPFSAKTFEPFSEPKESNNEKIINVSRERYGTSRQIVEEKITKWTNISDIQKTVQSASPSNLYDAKCSICGKDTKVVFVPDGVRPVYCKSCRKKKENENTGNNNIKKEEPKKKEEASGISLNEALNQKPIPFVAPKVSKKEEKPRVRKKVNLEELKETLKESLGNKEEVKKQPQDAKKRSINPGETVKFE